MNEVERTHLNAFEDIRDVRGNVSLDSIYEVTRKGITLLWEHIVAFLFTSDGFGIQTKDGYIIKCKDQ